jgi:hypothetical protein
MTHLRSSVLNILLSVGTLAVLLTATELALSIRLALKPSAPHRTQLIHEREEFLSQKYGPLIAEKPERGWDNSLVLHPFFGYVYNPDLPTANNFGFLCRYDFGLSEKGYSLTGVTAADPLVVGVFGGSFAQYMVEQTADYFTAKLRQLYPQREPVIVNFAIAGHAIPQTIFTFEYFRGIPDVAVFVDGFNEIMNYPGNNRAGVPPEYAKAAHYLYKLSLGLLTPDRFERTAHIIALRHRLARITATSLWPGVRRSIAVHLAWAAAVRVWEADLAAESKALELGFETDKRFFDASDAAMVTIAARQWRNYHRLASQVAASRGVADYHFLQPNPFVPGSKRHYTALEREALEPGRGEEEQALVLGYSLIGRELEALSRQDGAVARDLTKVFLNDDGEIWVDTCHANAAGYRIVVDAIVRTMVEHGTVAKRGQ